jgi:hypothetical protein
MKNIMMNKVRFQFMGFGAIIFLMFLSSCTPKMEATMTSAVAWDKMDVALRADIRRNLVTDSDSTLVVLAEVTEDRDEFVADLNADDVQVQTRFGAIWTLRGNAQSLANASGKDFVKRMELSQKRRTS